MSDYGWDGKGKSVIDETLALFGCAEPRDSAGVAAHFATTGLLKTHPNQGLRKEEYGPSKMNNEVLRMRRRDFIRYGAAGLMVPKSGNGKFWGTGFLLPSDQGLPGRQADKSELDPSEIVWTAKWIWATPTGLEPDTYVYFRRAFTLASLPMGEVFIRISACTHYQLYVNGHKVGFGPPISDPLRCYFDSHDIRPYLKEGVNLIATCAYSLATATEDTKKERGRFIFQGRIDLPGKSVILDTGREWKCLIPKTWRRNAPRQSMQLHYVEIADFRENPEGWKTVDFNDSNWADPFEINEGTKRDFEHIVQRELGKIDESFKPVGRVVRIAEVKRQSRFQIPAVQVQAEECRPLRTVRMTNLSSITGASPRAKIQTPEAEHDAVIVFDMGEMVLGCPYFEIEGQGGTVVDVSISEYLKGGRVLAARKITPKESTFLTDRITLRDGKTIWQRNDYNGYRYIQFTVRNARKPAVIRKIGTVLRQYRFNQEATFRSSNSTLDRVFEGSKLTHKVNIHWGYCGSAWREHAQWSDLPWVSMNLAVFHDPPVMRYYLRQIALGQNSEGRMQFPYPGNQGIELPEQTMWLADDLWKCALYFNDRALVRDLLPAMVKANEWFRKHTTSRGLLSTRNWRKMWLVIDWGYPFVNDPDPGELATLNMIYYGFLCSVAKCAEFVGNKTEQREFEKQVDSLKRSINGTFWDAARDRYYEKPGHQSPSQFASTLAARYGIVPQERLQNVLNIAMGSELRPGKASPWFMESVLEAFARAGRFYEGVESISKYWSSFLNADSNVYWELWNIPGEDVHPISGYTHEMCARTITYSSAPASFVVRHLLGVRPLEPGFAEVLIAPHYAGLDYAGGDAPTSKGPVHVRWDRRPSQKETEIYLDIPEGLNAQVQLPFAESEPVVTLNNEPFYSGGQFRKNLRIGNPRRVGDSLQFRAKPGFYYFRCSAA